MDIEKVFVDFALLGADWVLWLLIVLSVVSIGVMIDRALWLRGRNSNTTKLVNDLRAAWRGGSLDDLTQRYRADQAIAVRVAMAGVAERAHGAEAVAEAMHGERARWRKEAEANVVILGTLGNNTPFVGLFGTVLGIIGALDQLQQSVNATNQEVMGELSKALVATAVGLIVAIPAVVAYNYFNRRFKALLIGADEAAHAVLGLVHADAEARDKEAA